MRSETGLLLFLLCMLGGPLSAQKRFVCFDNDKNSNLKITVCFDEKDKALYVKYKGQRDSIPVIYKSREKSENPGGGIPAYYWSETYQEKYNGKITGEYVFTNGGPYSLDLYYTRKKDGKEFYFTIPDKEYDDLNGIYKEQPCF